MPRHLVIDARHMEPPEPLERVLEAIGDFAPGDTLKLLINMEPRPLYGILARSGFAHRTEPGESSAYEVTIWSTQS